jgi:hypothetical protein
MKASVALITFIAAVLGSLNMTAQSRSDIDSLRQVIDAKSCDPIEGIWQLTDDGATIAITATAGVTGTYDIVLIDATDMSIEPMTPCGTLRHTAGSNTYDAHLRLNPAAGAKSRYKDFMVTITADGRFTLNSYNRTKHLNLRRILPYMFRASFAIERSNRPEGVDGAVRIYPKGGATHPITL